MAKKTKPLRSYRHQEASRVNLPTEEASASGEEAAPVSYTPPPRREGTDPVLDWDRDPTAVDDSHEGPVLWIREKVLPTAFVSQLLKPETAVTPNLFDDFNGLPADHSVFEYYQHHGHWQNRLIHGESTRVMSSLLAREDLASQVQVVYFDPPYGIGYRSNFQPSTSNLNVSEKSTSVPVGDPASVTAFRDTYRNGIHSYLDSIYARLVLIRELLAATGSLFLQIGDDHVHRLAVLCDEVFGHENRMATITWRPTAGSSSGTLPESASYILWYAKDRDNVKYRQLYEPYKRKGVIEAFSSYAMLELSDGTTRKLARAEKIDPDKELPAGARVYKRENLTSQGASNTGRTCWYEYDGVWYHPGDTRHWGVSTPEERTLPNEGRRRGTRASGESSPMEGQVPNGLDRLAELGRLDGAGEGHSLHWKWYEEEVPGLRIDNVWYRMMSPSKKRYVVETAASVVERCILMASDPGDLVFDPTCGSGVTADAAEHWGRRWITCDTSPVAVAIARQRVLTGVHPWWSLDSESPGATDPAAGFVYETIQRVSAATLAYDQVDDPDNTIELVDRPGRARSVLRVCSPFTVETESPYTYVPFDQPEAGPDDLGVAAAQTQVNLVERLEGAKVKTADGRQALEIIDLDPWPTGRLTTHEALCQSPNREDEFLAAVMLAAPDASVTSQQAALAVNEAKKHLPEVKHLILVGWAFTPGVEAVYRDVEVLKVQANRDLQITQLADDPGDESFTMLGEPELIIHPEPDERVSVEVIGYDTYDPATGGVASGDQNQIAAWMIDTDHDGASFFSTLTYLPAAGKDPNLKRLIKELGRTADQDAKDKIVSMRSQPFPPTGKPVAVKIVTTTGAEMTTLIHPDEITETLSRPPAGL